MDLHQSVTLSSNQFNSFDIKTSSLSCDFAKSQSQDDDYQFAYHKNNSNSFKFSLNEDHESAPIKAADSILEGTLPHLHDSVFSNNEVEALLNFVDESIAAIHCNSSDDVLKRARKGKEENSDFKDGSLGVGTSKVRPYSNIDRQRFNPQDDNCSRSPFKLQFQPLELSQATPAQPIWLRRLATANQAQDTRGTAKSTETPSDSSSPILPVNYNSSNSYYSLQEQQQQSRNALIGQAVLHPSSHLDPSTLLPEHCIDLITMVDNDKKIASIAARGEATSDKACSYHQDSSTSEGSQSSSIGLKSQHSTDEDYSDSITDTLSDELFGLKRKWVEKEQSSDGKVRYLCPVQACDKLFSTSGHARRHSRTHCKLRPFNCFHQGCGAMFSRKDNRNQHQRTRHKMVL